jgi:hypothetical protein
MYNNYAAMHAIWSDTTNMDNLRGADATHSATPGDQEVSSSATAVTGFGNTVHTYSGDDNSLYVPCAFSLADLKGGWVNQVHINTEGLGTWDNGSRPPFHVTVTGTCGDFDFDFPDDSVYRGTLSDDHNSISFGWTRTSA